MKWLGENHINVRLSGAPREDGYAVYKIREIAFGGGVKLSAEDGFLQYMIERLLSSDAPSEEIPDEDEEETGDSMKLTSIQSITDFITCAGRTLPDNIPSVGEKKSGCCAFPRGIRGRAPSRSESFVHYDEYSMEGQLL